jgi:hypothetical protein
VFKFRLYLENGEDVGKFETAVPDWRIGDDFRNGDGNRFEIVNIVPLDGDDAGGFYGLWTVTPLELAEPASEAGARVALCAARPETGGCGPPA